MKRLVAVFCLSVFLLVPSAGAYEVDLPGEGNVFNSIPFDPFWGETRYQQIYDNSIFPAEGGEILAINFIPDSSGPYEADIEISLSHTTAVPGGLSVNLDENVTEVPLVAFSNHFSEDIVAPWEEGSYVLTNMDYGLSFILDVPFAYDPGKGNLLVDMVISGQSRSLSVRKMNPPVPYLSSRVWESQYGPDTDVVPAAAFTRFEFEILDETLPPDPEPVPTPDPTPVSLSTSTGSGGCNVVRDGGGYASGWWILLPLFLLAIRRTTKQ